MRIALAVLVLFLLAGCGPRGRSEGYLAACHGEPLASAEAREAAMMEGYDIYPGYDCITKESYAAVQAQKAAWEAANTPEAKARREAERLAVLAKAEEERAQQVSIGVPPSIAAPDPVDLRPVDANTATQAQLAAVVSLDEEVAAQIVAAREERPFRDWADLVARVVGLSAAQSAAFASICGLTVNGESLLGAPPDALMAQQIRDRRRRY